MLVFQLVDATRRTFQAQRYCFLGSVDDWIEIGKPGKTVQGPEDTWGMRSRLGTGWANTYLNLHRVTSLARGKPQCAPQKVTRCHRWVSWGVLSTLVVMPHVGGLAPLVYDKQMHGQGKRRILNM